MNKRTIEIKVRLNRKEAESLNKRVKKSRISRESYIRHLINGSVPREAPPPDYFSMMQEMYRIGDALNQISQQAHLMKSIDTKRYDDGIRQFETAVKKITESVVLPQPIKIKRE